MPTLPWRCRLYGMETRQVLHTLVDEIPEGELAAVKRFLECLLQQAEDPLRAFLNAAPWDDESVTDEDRLAIQQGLAEKTNGEVVSHEDIERLLGGAHLLFVDPE